MQKNVTGVAQHLPKVKLEETASWAIDVNASVAMSFVSHTVAVGELVVRNTVQKCAAIRCVWRGDSKAIDCLSGIVHWRNQ